jgi:integrase
LAEALRKERETADDENGWIFPSPRPGTSKSGHRDRMDKPFRRAVVAAGLDPSGVTPHTMRHSAITKLVKAGTDIATIQRISGHKTTAMVMRYTHVYGQHIDKAMAALGRKVQEPAGNATADAVAPKLHIVAKSA